MGRRSRHNARTRAGTTAGLATLALATLLLPGCSVGGTQPGGSAGVPGSDGKLRVVASTNVWASVVREVGGPSVEVESVIDDPSADPHSYEATPADAAKLSQAQLVVSNGGGYDDFVTTMLPPGKPHVQAVQGESGHEGHGHAPDQHGHGEPHSGEQAPAPQPPEQHGQEHGPQEGPGHAPEPHGEQGHEQHGSEPQPAAEPANEHVWYDIAATREVGKRISAELTRLRPAQAGEFQANLGRFEEQLNGLQSRVDSLAQVHQGKKVLLTEPVSGRLVQQAKLTDATPVSFSRAIEAETDPPAGAVAEVQQALTSRQVNVLIYNPQTESPITQQIRTQAEQQRIPVVELSEALPAEQSYVPWMAGQVSNLDSVLRG